MTRNVHVPLLRLGRVLLFAAVWMMGLSVFILMPPSAAHREGTKAFIAFAMLLPLAFGLPLTAILHEAMHRPFALLLPSAGWRFIQSHAIVTIGFALGCAGLAMLADRALPFATVACIAAAAFALPLPLEPGWRWAGSRAAAVVVISIGFAAVLRAGTIKPMVIAHPFAAGVVGLILTMLIFAVSFSSPRRRARALIPYTSYLSAAFAPELKSRLSNEAIARKPVSRAPWGLRVVGNSTIAWVRAVFHERFGHERAGWTGMMLGLGVGLIVLGIGLAARDPGRFAERGAQGLSYVVLFSLIAQRSCGPRPAVLYPISRLERAKVAFAASAWQLGMSVGWLFIATLIATGIASRWFGAEMQPPVIGKLVTPFLFAVAFGPLVQWLNLHVEVRNDRSFQIFCSLLALIAPYAGAQYAQRWPTMFLSPGGLAIATLVIGTSQVAYYTALRRFYRKGDLVQRDATVAKLGLV